MSAAGRNQPESAAPASERDESRPRHTPPAGASSSKPVYLVGAAAQAKPGVAPQVRFLHNAYSFTRKSNERKARGRS